MNKERKEGYSSEGTKVPPHGDRYAPHSGSELTRVPRTRCPLKKSKRISERNISRFLDSRRLGLFIPELKETVGCLLQFVSPEVLESGDQCTISLSRS
jgi:hypothetical protein